MATIVTIHIYSPALFLTNVMNFQLGEHEYWAELQEK